MSRLEDLIQELCPDGVEYKTLDEVFDIRNGYTPSKSNPEFWDNGSIPWFRMEDIRANGRILSDSIQHITEPAIKGNLFPAYSIIMATSATIGEHALLTVDSLANQRFTYLTRKPVYIGKLDMMFFFHYCFIIDEWCKNNTTLGNFLSVDMGKFKQYEIPIPPIEVQREIVRILDNFTELTAELTARKKQYEHYRDNLLTFGDDVEWKPLGEVCIVQSGGTPQKTNSEYWNNGTVKWLGSTVCKNQKTVDEVTNYITELGLSKSSAKLMKKETTLIALVGATIGKVAFLPFEATINQNIAGIYPADTKETCPSYVYYACTMLYSKFLELGNGKLAMANLSFVRGLKIPVPPIAEQERIVAILDRFDTLCNDISGGLPAEIEARKKQYEYYRDKLLTFKEFA